MRNVTITLDDETARWTRIEAARHDTSVSRFIGELLRRQMIESEAYARAHASFRARRPVSLGAGQPYPSRDDLHRR